MCVCCCNIALEYFKACCVQVRLEYLCEHVMLQVRHTAVSTNIFYMEREWWGLTRSAYVLCEQSGLVESGDMIVSVAGRECKPLSLTEITDLLQAGGPMYACPPTSVHTWIQKANIAFSASIRVCGQHPQFNYIFLTSLGAQAIKSLQDQKFMGWFTADVAVTKVVVDTLDFWRSFKNSWLSCQNLAGSWGYLSAYKCQEVERGGCGTHRHPHAMWWCNLQSRRRRHVCSQRCPERHTWTKGLHLRNVSPCYSLCLG